ncbi:hypothetical protein POVWA2_037510 [Plasmodium ovale wallikeri]|uniref:Uncharacterized protein n=1 Tax=Plasmodium ovale wallikeri TaxID=864142 RepID=A0A1A8Z683_PLAOA|nr:hypothetical protein POVWA2_037510 [Plasmodium ovale wallikeri]
MNEQGNAADKPWCKSVPPPSASLQIDSPPFYNMEKWFWQIPIRSLVARNLEGVLYIFRKLKSARSIWVYCDNHKMGIARFVIYVTVGVK